VETLSLPITVVYFTTGNTVDCINFFPRTSQHIIHYNLLLFIFESIPTYLRTVWLVYGII